MNSYLKEKGFLDEVMWFERRLKIDFDDFDILEPQRRVNRNGRYRSGVIYSEKCKREVQYESGYELEFIKKLEKCDDVVFYYEQPVQVKYRRGRHPGHTTPDFTLFLKSKEVVIVEIKPLQNMLDYNVQSKVEGLLDFCSRKGFGLLLTDGKDSLEKVRKTRCNRKLQNRILKYLSEHEMMRSTACKEIMKGCDASQNELLKVILKHNLKFNRFPFKIRTDNRNRIFHKVFGEDIAYDDLVMKSIVETLKF